ncbi:hypothetical protein [Saccharicrinis sp. 156]|uniref:hypothetical protein n=1 Tax=Saccharicrinis sp. 156 TaxID=3417574 RepID=UPI003D32A649
MKTKLFVLMLMTSWVCFSCAEEESDEFCSNPDAECPDGGPSIDVNACCTDQSCYWTYNGEDYNCEGTDCSGAYDIIIVNACAVGALADLKSSDTRFNALKAELESVTQKLLLEARACAACN